MVVNNSKVKSIELSNIQISVIIPCFNEKSFIDKCLTSILKQKLPEGIMEILVVDGMSTDGTREVLKHFSEKYDSIRILDNPLHKTPTAMNLGIRASRGQYVAIMGAHTEYDEGYLANSIKLFDVDPSIVCTGGPLDSKGRTVFGKAVALAMSSPIGVGNARHRFSDYEGYAEIACFPVFKKEIFDIIGLYDESLVRNQDDELTLRLIRSGYKIYLSPSVKCVYYVRDNPSKLFKQYFYYGFWRVAVLKKHKIPASLRQMAPIGLLLIFLLAILFSMFLPYNSVLISITLPILYMISIILLSVPVMIKNDLKTGLLFPLAVIILHQAYALGFLKGIFKEIIKE